MVRFFPELNDGSNYFKLIFVSISANNFGKTIGELESTQSALFATLEGNKTLLQNVQEAFAVNLENVNQDVGKFENRLKLAEKK